MRTIQSIVVIILCIVTNFQFAYAQISITTCNNNLIATVNSSTTATVINNTGDSVLLLIEAKGGGGGRGKDGLPTIHPGGEGAIIKGEFILAPNATILAISGSKGPDFSSTFNSTPSFFAGGGGGGSGAVNCGNPADCGNGLLLLIAAGGAGGAYYNQPAYGGSVTNMACGNGGIAGSAAGGGGCLSAGASSTTSTGGGIVLKTGVSSAGVVTACYPCTPGASGMGGGGAGNVDYGGGGGGATGGAGDGSAPAISFNSGKNQINTAGGNGVYGTTGYVTITCLSFNLLPIELLSFRAKLYENQVLLLWETASESNNKGFEIERSYDGAQWLNIAFLRGVGSSSSIQKYSYTDKNLAQTQAYYRLKQIDVDGKVTYSNIINVSIKGNNTIKLKTNITQTELTIYADIATSFDIYSMTGQLIMTGQLSDIYSDIDIASLPPAMYIVKTATGTAKFVKY